VCGGGRAAFTLVELLAVIAIIALLIALLMPALGKVRAKAVEVNCAANLRSVGQAMVAYVQQYGVYPGTDSGFKTPVGYVGGYAVWPVRLRPMLGGERRAFHCPALDERFEWARGGPGRVPTGENAAFARAFGYEPDEPVLEISVTPLSYGYNAYGYRGGNMADRVERQHGLGAMIHADPDGRSATQFVEMRAARVRSPSEMIAVADLADPGAGFFVIFPAHDAPFMWPGTVHGGGANVLFCDGHVAWYAQHAILDVDGPNGPMIRRLWNNDNLP
jgi:prepilin-type processing-associated H-X9-DG protein/prepilin-type N-terminal cleavage/methylation domain-containing protein